MAGSLGGSVKTFGECSSAPLIQGVHSVKVLCHDNDISWEFEIKWGSTVTAPFVAALTCDRRECLMALRLRWIMLGAFWCWFWTGSVAGRSHVFALRFNSSKDRKCPIDQVKLGFHFTVFANTCPFNNVRWWTLRTWSWYRCVCSYHVDVSERSKNCFPIWLGKPFYTHRPSFANRRLKTLVCPFERICKDCGLEFSRKQDNTDSGKKNCRYVYTI